MADKQIFERREMKYLLEEDQYHHFQKGIQDYLEIDKYGITDICSCYYDTPDFRMIRNSLESATYKEKLRLRSYGVPQRETKVYLELKKKFEKIVYKRREELSMQEAENYFQHELGIYNSLIFREIDWVRRYYKYLQPSMYISYRRLAMIEPQGTTRLRVTFDWDVLWRTENVQLISGIYGTPLLEPGQRILEIKTQQAMPLWLVDILDDMKIYPTSYSKYGNAYRQIQKQ